MDDFIARVGTFFYLVGITLIALFIASDASSAHAVGVKTNYDYFFIALMLFIIGFFFRKRAAPPPAADRFRSLRKWQDDQKKKKEPQFKGKQDQKK